MNVPELQENTAAPRGAVFRLAPSELLPAVCPACGAQGTRPHTLKVSDNGSPRAELDAYFCDICADEQNARTTRHLAWFGAMTLLVLGATTAAALALGTRQFALQLALPLLVGGLAPAALLRTAIWPSSRDPVTLSADGEGLLLSTTSRKFRRTLLEHGLVETRGAAPRRASIFHRPQPPVVLIVVGWVWLAVLHSLGGAHVRVLTSGREKAVLLVDTRHFGQIAPTNAEDPRAGGSVRVLGGRRHLALVSETGVPLGGATKTIWPGRTYIVGQLPPGKCLFWERREYGSGAHRSILYPLGGNGPVWELRDQVDSWFVPLESPDAEQEAETEQWETRGGTRRAIRLLPCRAFTR